MVPSKGAIAFGDITRGCFRRPPCFWSNQIKRKMGFFLFLLHSHCGHCSGVIIVRKSSDGSFEFNHRMLGGKKDAWPCLLRVMMNAC